MPLVFITPHLVIFIVDIWNKTIYLFYFYTYCHENKVAQGLYIYMYAIGSKRNRNWWKKNDSKINLLLYKISIICLDNTKSNLLALWLVLSFFDPATTILVSTLFVKFASNAPNSCLWMCVFAFVHFLLEFCDVKQDTIVENQMNYDEKISI